MQRLYSDLRCIEMNLHTIFDVSRIAARHGDGNRNPRRAAMIEHQAISPR
jgi:hypothetical protein